MKQRNGALTAKQRRAITVLLGAPTITAAAATLGVGEQTLYAWLTEPAFVEAYHRARRHMVGQSISYVQRATSSAVSTLIEILNDRNEDATARVAAARAILELAYKGVEVEDLGTRLAALESAGASANGHTPPVEI